MPLQTLPPLALSYSKAQRADIDTALEEVAAQWRRIGPRFDTGWSLVGPYIAAAVMKAQRQMVERADEFIPSVLEDTGQAEYVEPAADANSSALVGLTGAGYAVDDSLSEATIRAKQAVGAGQSVPKALDVAGGWLAQSALTVMADTMRGAESLGRYTRNVGYVRVVHGGACGRCVILAGRWYQANAGFPRHPRCKCGEMPASEQVAGDWQTNPDAYFHSLNPEQQIKLMGSKANAQAVADGADMNRIVNAYGKKGGVYTAQQTPTGRIRASKVGYRGQPMGQVRLMPETIARLASTDAERLKMLRTYGWIV